MEKAIYSFEIPVITTDDIVLSKDYNYELQLYKDAAVFKSGMITGTTIDDLTKVEEEVSFDFRFFMLKKCCTGVNLFWSRKMKRYCLSISWDSSSSDNTWDINFLKRKEGEVIQSEIVKWLLS